MEPAMKIIARFFRWVVSTPPCPWEHLEGEARDHAYEMWANR